jgi:hypothetical protein
VARARAKRLRTRRTRTTPKMTTKAGANGGNLGRENERVALPADAVVVDAVVDAVAVAGEEPSRRDAAPVD